jgi:hypothetical protein
LLGRNNVFLHVNTAIFRRRALLDVGVFDPMLQWHSDWFAIYAIALRSGFCAVPRQLSWFRIEPGSFSARGIRDRRRQEEVMVNIIDKLGQAKFAYLRRALLSAPSAMSPFMRSMLMALVKRPTKYRELLWIGAWWMVEFLRGRRPAAWAAWVRGIRNPLAKAVRE